MNKVAILTTHRANNFGAVLQAFSLVTKCRELGADAEILDWRTSLFEWQYRNPWRRLSRNPIPGLRYAWRWFVYEKRSRQRFDEFRRLLPMSPKATTKKELENVAGRYDSFIVGSDQVWNPGQTELDPCKFDRTYLLDFVAHGQKNAYAASMGKEAIRPPELVPEFKRAWETFNMITMREAAGADFVSKTIGQKIETVLDPVLLHTADFWREHQSSLVTPKVAYVLVYNVQHYRKESQWMMDMAQRYAKEHGCRVVDVFVPSALSRWTSDSVSAGPAEFIHLINNADAVFTNSFHAAAFSVIFRKKMFLHRSDTPTTTNTRFDTLINVAKLSMKEFASCGELEHIFKCECGEFSESDLKRIREHSIQLLEGMVR